MSKLGSTTSANAKVTQRGDDLGRVAPGYLADLIALNSNPLTDVSIFERYRSEKPVAMEGGDFIRNELV